MTQGSAKTNWDNRAAFAKEIGGNKKSLSAFGWVGGKSQLSAYLLEMFPEHTKYIEVFGGDLNLLWSKKRSKLEVVNDFDSELVNLYKAIKLHPQSLSRELETMWHSRELFAAYKNGMARAVKNDIQRAAITYYVIATSFAGKRQHFGRSLNAAKITTTKLYRDFRVWSERLKTVQIENQDFEKLIRDYDSDDAFFYLDPPYYGCEDYYQGGEGFGRADHERLAADLKGVKGKWLLSYNDTPQIRELYREYEIHTTPEINYTLSKSKPTKVREIVIKNY